MAMKTIINFLLFRKGNSDNTIKMCLFPGQFGLKRDYHFFNNKCLCLGHTNGVGRKGSKSI